MDEKSSPDFEEIKYEDPKKQEALFEISKKDEWNQIVPRILDSINSNQEEQYFKKQGEIFLPSLNVQSEILSNEQIKEIHSKLPYYHQQTNWTRVYNMTKDGCDMKTFYSKSEEINNSLLVVKDDEGNIFGGYASEAFVPTGNFYGTGECFLFTFFKEGKKIRVYRSTNENDFYLYGDNNQICFGCSENNFSLSIRENLLKGYSKPTLTYKNLPLNGNKDNFVVVKLELWKFGEN